MKVSKKILSILVFIAFCATFLVPALSFAAPASSASAAENTYYLSPDGDDENPGTKEEPWATFAHAGEILNAGDTLLVRGGMYPNDSFFPANSGTVQKPITVKAYPGEKPEINGSSLRVENMHFDAKNKYFIIDGIAINDVDISGSPVAIYGEYIEFRNCTFKNSASAFIWINASNTKIINCMFDTVASVKGQEWGDHAIVVRKCTNVLIEGCYFTKCGNNAILAREYLQEITKNIVIRNNTIEQYWGGGINLSDNTSYCLVEGNKIFYSGKEEPGLAKAGITISGSENIVRNNLIINANNSTSTDNGIVIEAVYDHSNENAQNNRIYNNVVYKASGKALALVEKSICSASGNKVLNNIFYYNRLAGPNDGTWKKGSFYIHFYVNDSDSKGWRNAFNNNTIYNNLILHAETAGDRPDIPVIFTTGDEPGQKSWFSGTLKEFEKKYPTAFFGNIQKNPGFANAAKNNFSLVKGSAAVDAGAHLTKTTAAGANTTKIKVQDARFFTYGYGLVSGDNIMVGKNIAKVSAVDIKTNTITVVKAITFKAGDFVDLPYSGKAPDLGAFEFNPPVIK